MTTLEGPRNEVTQKSKRIQPNNDGTTIRTFKTCG